MCISQNGAQAGLKGYSWVELGNLKAPFEGELLAERAKDREREGGERKRKWKGKGKVRIKAIRMFARKGNNLRLNKVLLCQF